MRHVELKDYLVITNISFISLSQNSIYENLLISHVWLSLIQLLHIWQFCIIYEKLE